MKQTTKNKIINAVKKLINYKEEIPKIQETDTRLVRLSIICKVNKTQFVDNQHRKRSIINNLEYLTEEIFNKNLYSINIEEEEEDTSLFKTEIGIILIRPIDKPIL